MDTGPGALPWILGFYTLSFPLLLVVSLIALWKESRKRLALRARFGGVVDIEAEIRRMREVANEELHELQSVADRQRAEITVLQGSYREKHAVYDHLVRQVAIFDDTLAFAEMGLYAPHFDFSDSDEYKENIAKAREAQKTMITAKTAAYCTKEWTVEGSRAKGEVMTSRNIRLTLRAFNGECDAAIANTRWNNAKAMEQRIVNARQQIDKHNASNSIFIGEKYVELKLLELQLTHEYREKQKQEKEERAELARQAREEQKLQRDLESAHDEEGRYAKLLAKARLEASTIAGDKLSAFEEQIKLLERDLSEAHAKVARAQAMAERTRSGYVYVISNVGSFGDDVIKIGLTRRLDPSDRVRELGDASVPFFFDTHAIIYSDDAPALEHALHQQFESVRVNTSNFRKEFFRASIGEVEAAVRRLAPGATFFSDIEAQEYRETLARRQASLQTGGQMEFMPAAI